MGERWAQYWANRYSWALKIRNDIDGEDLLQAALMGEYIARKKYTPGKGEFATFSSYYIRNEIRDLLGIRRGQLPPYMISLDEPLTGKDGETGEETRLDMLEDKSIPDKDEELYKKELRQGVRAAIARLKKPEQREILTRFYIGLQGAKAIGEAMGLTQSRVLHIVTDARREMRKDRLLRQLAEIPIPQVYVSVTRFQSTHTSAVELAAIIRENERARINRQIEQTQEEYCKYKDKVI